MSFETNPIYEHIIESIIDNKYAICDDFFSPLEVSLLKQQIALKQEQELFRAAAIGNGSQEQVLKSVRSDSILWIDDDNPDEIERVFLDKIRDLISYLNRTCYLGIEDGEFHYAIYPEGTFYKKHLDVFQTDSRRTLSVILYLNDNDWKPEDGGQLALYLPNENGEIKELEILPKGGRLAIFDSKTIEHEVKMVNRTRYSITGWLKKRALSYAV